MSKGRKNKYTDESIKQAEHCHQTVSWPLKQNSLFVVASDARRRQFAAWDCRQVHVRECSFFPLPLIRIRTVVPLINHERALEFHDNRAVLIDASRLDAHQADART